jgi:uncharacterized protein (TIGR00730 family)
MRYVSMAVFCGSKSGNNPLFLQHAKELGMLIAEQNIQLVYGGGRVGLMGAVSDAVMQHGGTVIGVIPKVLLKWEQQHNGITDLRVVEDMHERKKMMYELCDAAVILPGGNGTMDELFEMVTWNTLKIHEKKIILLNTAGYYDELISHLQKMETEGFLHENWQSRITLYNTPAAIFSAMGADKTQSLL